MKPFPLIDEPMPYINRFVFLILLLLTINVNARAQNGLLSIQQLQNCMVKTQGYWVYSVTPLNAKVSPSFTGWRQLKTKSNHWQVSLQDEVAVDLSEARRPVSIRMVFDLSKPESFEQDKKNIEAFLDDMAKEDETIVRRDAGYGWHVSFIDYPYHVNNHLNGLHVFFNQDAQTIVTIYFLGESGSLPLYMDKAHFLKYRQKMMDDFSACIK